MRRFVHSSSSPRASLPRYLPAFPAALHSHGATGAGSAHSPLLALCASSCAVWNAASLEYLSKRQAMPALTIARFTSVPSTNTLPSVRAYRSFPVARICTSLPNTRAERAYLDCWQNGCLLSGASISTSLTLRCTLPAVRTVRVSPSCTPTTRPELPTVGFVRSGRVTTRGGCSWPLLDGICGRGSGQKRGRLCGCWQYAGQREGFRFSMILGWLGCSEVRAVECAVPRTPTFKSCNTFKSPQSVVQPYPEKANSYQTDRQTHAQERKAPSETISPAAPIIAWLAAPSRSSAPCDRVEGWGSD